MQKKNIIAMLLAGGQGTRLGILTKENAKPAVPFGGKYRIIDFPLSNCSNSGIDTVGVLTQYQPLILNSHIGIGAPWDLDINNGGMSILPPHTKKTGGNWYKGTADAIYQNIDFISNYDPDYVLILSGDHIYKMNYIKMLDYHKKMEADVTISVIEVPKEETYRFGIMNVEDDYKIYEFEEKPKQAKSNLASMGIYIFNWSVLKKSLIEDAESTGSSNDFGKDIIPKLLERGSKMYAYPFKGYWKDVGTLESLWEANLDLLNEDNELNLHDSSWKIYSANPVRPPQYVGADAKIQASFVVDGCSVLGEVEHSVLFAGVSIGEGSKVKDSVIMSNAVIGENVTIERAIIGENVVIKDNEKVGSNEKLTVVAENE